MMGPVAAILPCGTRLHLQHGPIDLIIYVDGDRDRAFQAAYGRFKTILDELVGELPFLREQLLPETGLPNGVVAKNMHFATEPFCHSAFITRMAAVAGSVADTVLEAMKSAASFDKAYVNNGGDIAHYLKGDATFITAMSSHIGQDLGRIEISSRDGIGGIATSGRHGRSLSLGIADSVTVLAKSAAQADAAATMIANAVDLPDYPLNKHSFITRVPANSLDPDSDLGTQLVVTNCQNLSLNDQKRAVDLGAVSAQNYFDLGLIKGAAIFLFDETRIIGSNNLNANLKITERVPQYA